MTMLDLNRVDQVRRKTSIRRVMLPACSAFATAARETQSMQRAGPSRVALIVPGVVCLAFAVALAVQLSREMREDFYWTPPELAPTLPEVADRLEILVDGQPLDQALGNGELRRPDGTVPGPEDVHVRFNDAERVERRQAILLTASLTAGIVLLVIAALPGARGRREAPR